MENSIVFDGAYPNAVIQSAIGEEIETPKGKFKILEGKENLSEKDIIFGYSTAGGNINLLCKQSLGKGGLENMAKNENEVTEFDKENEELETNQEVEETTEETTGEVTEQESTETIEEVTEETENSTEESNEEALSVEKAILERFGNMCETVDELIEMAKEGLENRNLVIAQALESGVHSMGNAFNKDIFTKTFSNMKTKDIKDMGETWEAQAQDKFCKGKVSKQDLSNKSENVEFKRIELKQFKTDNY